MGIDFGRKLIIKYQKNIKLVYGVLVDDLGMACSDESCIITPQVNNRTQHVVGLLPDEIEDLIQANSLIKRDKLMIFSERTSNILAIEIIKNKLKGDTQGLSVTDVAGYSEINVAIKDFPPFMLANTAQRLRGLS